MALQSRFSVEFRFRRAQVRANRAGQRSFRWWSSPTSGSSTWYRVRAAEQVAESTQLKINRYDGGGSLDLLVVNDAGMTVWAKKLGLF